jgi:hypothetical protein
MRVRRYFFTAYHLTRDVVQTITFPRAGCVNAAAAGGAAAAGTDFKIKFLIYAFRPESDSAYCYIEFEDQVAASTMIARLEDLGATCVYPDNFDKKVDGAQLALAAVKFITDIGLLTRVHFTSGSPTNGSMVQHCIRLEHNSRAPVQSESDEKKTGALLECVRDTGSSIVTAVNKRADTTDLSINNMQSEIVQRLDVQGDQIEEIGVEMTACSSNIAVVVDKMDTEIEIKNRRIQELEVRVQELEKEVKHQAKLADQAQKLQGDMTQLKNTIAKLRTAEKHNEELQANINHMVRLGAVNGTADKQIKELKTTINRQNATIDYLLRSDAVLNEVVDVLGRQNNKRTRDIANGGSEEEEEDEPMSE